MIEGNNVSGSSVVGGMGGCVGRRHRAIYLDASGYCPESVGVSVELDGLATGAVDMSALLVEVNGAAGVAQWSRAQK